MSKICLTGTTGALGSNVLKHVLNTLKADPSSFVISLYNPAKAPSVPAGVSIRRADYLDPSTLPAAFTDCSKLFLVSYPTLAYEKRVIAHKNAINAAQAAGVKHIYYTSLAFGDDSKAFVKQAHNDTEAYLKQLSSAPGSDLTYTIIKEGIYCESFPLYFGFFDRDRLEKSPSQRTIKVPSLGGPGPAWITQNDLGEATAKIIFDNPSKPRWKNQTVLLSGGEAISLPQLADLINDILGWKDPPLRVEAVGDEAWLDAISEIKTGRAKDVDTREYYGSWASTYPAMEKGELAVVDPLAEELLGRKAVTMRQFLEGLFAGGGEQRLDVDEGNR
ncbi:MAG: hypothetical protein Q9227_003612 [Pyrenula ochraceoflavens]